VRAARRIAVTFIYTMLFGGAGAGCRTGQDAMVTDGDGHQKGAPTAAVEPPSGTEVTAQGTLRAGEPQRGSPVAGPGAPAAEENPILTDARLTMVSEQVEARGVRDPAVLEAMRKIPRHRYVPGHLLEMAYNDSPLPIGEGQTISQPYIVAIMSELLHVKPGDRVLEVGTGSGYQAAVLAEMGVHTYTIEIVESLASMAKERLETMGYRNVHCRAGDGYRGWPEAAPFDAVIVTAAPDHVPRPLVDQLKVGGRLVIPVGTLYQELRVITKTKDGSKSEEIIPVRFVPMTGEAQGAPH